MIRTVETDPDEAERWERFGRALTDAMAKSRLRTQKQLAAALGVDQTLVSSWKRGLKLRRMTPGRVAKIERALGVEACPPGTLSAILYDRLASPRPLDRVSDLEERLDRVEQGVKEMLELLRDLDRRIRGTSRGGDEEE